MKKVLMVLWVMAAAFAAQAQSDAKSKSILAALSKKYKSYDVVKSDFTLSVSNPKAGVKQVQQGSILVKANAGKYKVTMTGQELISDGKSLWTYLKEDREVQVTNADQGSEALNPAKIFTLYEQGFRSVYAGQKKIGTRTYDLIDLFPATGKKSFSKVRLTVDKAATRIADMVIADKNGSTYTYQVKTFTPNVKVSETSFTFEPKKYPGVEVVDLR